jgi:putative transposase
LAAADVDETYIKVDGRWCDLYRAIDRSGALVDLMFSEHRDMAAACAFFRSAKATTGVIHVNTPEPDNSLSVMLL